MFLCLAQSKRQQLHKQNAIHEAKVNKRKMDAMRLAKMRARARATQNSQNLKFVEDIESQVRGEKGQSGWLARVPATAH